VNVGSFGANTSPRGQMRSIMMSASVGLSTRISQQSHGWTGNFRSMLTVSVSWSFCGGIAVLYVLPILWMS